MANATNNETPALDKDGLTYLDKVRRCEIPAGPNWNARYRAALVAQGLSLSDAPSNQRDLFAPLAVASHPESWPADTYIVDAD